ncbi:hypothetical protein COU91_00625 [Candidatus Saccharibacteria bacterium CG10_big_fil_rev_8_21_14_0_10_47_8]|nr:MAG: hypothetical protein COU91_00625 [Candidatus Saccharibacteria bacterium CG10_big_fil_rev_8_21_14_0_10_47_8]
MKLKSHSNPVEAFKSFFVPDLTGAVLYFFGSLVLLGLFNSKALWHWLTGSFVMSGSGSALPATYTSAIDSFWVFISQSRLLQILFWVFVGIVAYTFVWFIWNVINNLRNDVVAGDYVHPRSYTRISYWRSVLESKVIFTVSVIALLIYFVLFFKLFSVIANLSLSAIENFRLINSLVLLVSSMLAGTFLLYFLVILVRVAKNSWQSIYKGL